jgi:pyruvate/2-oxoglutarate dehydrogenase complex dihydrolipoamide dehydrogenase (E3) component
LRRPFYQIAGLLWPHRAGTTIAKTIPAALVHTSASKLLLKSGKKITLVEMLPKIAGDLGKTRRGFSLNGLKSGGTRIFTNAKCTQVLDNGIEVEEDSRRELLTDIDTVIIAVGFSPVTALIDCLKSSGR